MVIAIKSMILVMLTRVGWIMMATNEGGAMIVIMEEEKLIMKAQLLTLVSQFIQPNQALVSQLSPSAQRAIRSPTY